MQGPSSQLGAASTRQLAFPRCLPIPAVPSPASELGRLTRFSLAFSSAVTQVVASLNYWLVGRGRRALDLLPQSDRAFAPLIIDLAFSVARGGRTANFQEVPAAACSFGCVTEGCWLAHQRRQRVCLVTAGWLRSSEPSPLPHGPHQAEDLIGEAVRGRMVQYGPNHQGEHNSAQGRHSPPRTNWFSAHHHDRHQLLLTAPCSIARPPPISQTLSLPDKPSVSFSWTRRNIFRLRGFLRMCPLSSRPKRVLDTPTPSWSNGCRRRRRRALGTALRL